MTKIFKAYDTDDNPVGVVVCKQERHKSGLMRGYIAMLSIRKSHRRMGIATKLVKNAIQEMIMTGAEEVRFLLLKRF